MAGAHVQGVPDSRDCSRLDVAEALPWVVLGFKFSDIFFRVYCLRVQGFGFEAFGCFGFDGLGCRIQGFGGLGL